MTTLVCQKDGYTMELDGEIMRVCVEAGWPAVELYRCRLGHSHRVWPAEAARTYRRITRERWQKRWTFELETVPRLDPLQGRMPRSWGEGWLRSFGCS